ncbi:hypothetical protein [Paramylibacter kogurei]|uniref:hypothetical protein n=1 Tax=Paramylibacter kogurei TaxID=1889778 RepID=UPI0013FDA4F4|nr:hypothetical protein [Amylibacter kogurei]
MTIRKDHEVHKRRGKTNLTLGVVLGAFVLLVFAITISKMVGEAKRVQSENATTTQAE